MSEDKEELVECCNCGDEIPEGDEITYDSQVFCQDCYDYNYVTCEGCDEVLERDSCYNSPDGNGIFCKGCFDERYFACRGCSNEYSVDSRYESDNTGDAYCQECYYDDFSHCEDCSTEVPRDDVCWSDERDVGLCEGCYDESDGQVSAGVHNYNYTPDLNFRRAKDQKMKGASYLGVEIEVENMSGSNSDYAETVCEYGNKGTDALLYCKEDGSINNGFEVVSHPMTLDYHLNVMKWDKIMKGLVEQGYRSYKTSTCGIHIHLSRQGLSRTEQVKLALFVYGNAEVFETLAQRKQSRWAGMKNVKEKKCGYCSTIGRLKKVNAHKPMYCGYCGKTTEPIGQKYVNLNHNSQRYEAINFQNDATIEFRLFKGTLKADTFKAHLELVASIGEFVKTINSVDIMRDDAWGKFKSFVKDNNRSYLVAYMEKRGV